MIEKISNIYISIEKNENMKAIISRLLFAIGIFVVFFYIFFLERAEINSDYTDTLLWAYESIKGRSIYNSEFYYAYMLPFGGSLLMLIPAILFGFTYKAHIIGMMIFALLLSLVLFFFFKMMFNDSNRGFMLAGMALVVFTCSKSMRLIFWGHIIQYSLGTMMVCVALIIINRILNGNDDLDSVKNNTKYYIILFVFSLLCMTNGVNMAPFYFVPIFLSLVLEALIDGKCVYGDEKFKQVTKIVIILFIATILGFVINKFLQRNINTTYVDTLMSFRPVDQWFISVKEFLSTWCSLGVGNISSGLEIASIDGIVSGVMYVFSLSILIIPIIALCYINKIESRMIRIQILAHFAILLVTWLTISVILTDNIGHEWRWGGAYSSAIITSILFIAWCYDHKDEKRWGIILYSFFLLTCILVVINISRMDRSYGANYLDRVKDCLKDNNLTYGYADFWDANAITMLSNDTVKVRSIELDVFEDGQVKSRSVPYRYQSEEKWYQDQPDTDKYFVYLRSGAYDNCPLELKKNAEETIEFEGGAGYILVYSKNIFKDGESIFDR